MSIRLGYQIPNFSYSTPVRDLFPTVIAQAREAEAAGFDAVFVMDHFYQLPGIGEPDEPMLEAYTALAALATRHRRDPAVRAGHRQHLPATRRCSPRPSRRSTSSAAAGRSSASAPAGSSSNTSSWDSSSARSPTGSSGSTEALADHLADAARRAARRSTGKWYQTESAINEPRIRDDLPVMLGGGGEKKTFGLAARYADHLNIICERRRAAAQARGPRRSAARRSGRDPNDARDELPRVRDARRGRRQRPRDAARVPAVASASTCRHCRWPSGPSRHGSAVRRQPGRGGRADHRPGYSTWASTA